MCNINVNKSKSYLVFGYSDSSVDHWAWLHVKIITAEIIFLTADTILFSIPSDFLTSKNVIITVLV